MNLSDDVEFIIMDDGSIPPLQYPDHGLKNLTIYPTNDFRPWTVGIARNAGAKLAKGTNILMCDIDYIIPKDVFEVGLDFPEDKMKFRRRFGILDEYGNFSDDLNVLSSYGLLQDRIDKKGAMMPPHPNTFIIKKHVYEMMGGYDEERIINNYPTHEDNDFKRRWVRLLNDGKVTESSYRPTIYMFPNGQFCGDEDYNPFGLFHNLSRKINHRMVT